MFGVLSNESDLVERGAAHGEMTSIAGKNRFSNLQYKYDVPNGFLVMTQRCAFNTAVAKTLFLAENIKLNLHLSFFNR